MKLILASKSPRRQQLMQMTGFSYTLRPKSVPEDYPPETPIEQVPIFLATKKALAFENEIQEDEVVLTADTVVIFEGEILGKPIDLAEAKQTLARLSGQVHQVITGVCLYSQKQKHSFSEKSQVQFAPLTEAEIDYYLHRQPPLDKAGAYGIQDWLGLIGVNRLEGCFYNVMGLPIAHLYQEIKKYFPDLLPFQA